ncbi:putative acyl-CoA desaturase [Rosa chinensis]|uniref:Putative acyl-CoA desaturase n=1 Tax=Rosa chinensis TaxID=74649 RepID=A0A2P6S1R8_ROSCH|nr:putative acyl-CoA desaturase [Rosa chinensis]
MSHFVKYDTTYLLNGLSGLETGNPFNKWVGFGFKFRVGFGFVSCDTTNTLIRHEPNPTRPNDPLTALIALKVLLYIAGGMPFLVWGTGVRTVAFQHAISGSNKFDLPLLGTPSRDTEGWQDNHHAFEHSARIGLEWWQIDVTWNVIIKTTWSWWFATDHLINKTK